NHLTPFWSNWFVLAPGTSNLYALNFGYDASDGGPISSVLNTNPPQGVVKLVGFSSTITNLCLSYNPLTNVDVSGWPALVDLECWHCPHLQAAAVTGCPRLTRTCLEAVSGSDGGDGGIIGTLDYAGSPNIADVRAASNTRMSNVNFDGGNAS